MTASVGSETRTADGGNLSVRAIAGAVLASGDGSDSGLSGYTRVGTIERTPLPARGAKRSGPGGAAVSREARLGDEPLRRVVRVVIGGIWLAHDG